ncbi:MAG: hypothetical protein E6R13_09125 [Spirochaetes bacterium]|nr:MAG: hypothetical protein E6R13_09125 [Spirochaetota bacterium]
MSDTTSTTTVQTGDIDLNELLGTPGGDNVIIPAGEGDKPNLFSRKPVDLSFLDKPAKTDDTPVAKPGDGKIDSPQGSDGKKDPDLGNSNPEGKTDDILDDIIKNNPEGKKDDSEDTKKGGRPTGLIELGTKLIEKGYLTPFEGEEDVSKYTLKDWEELFDANEKEKQKKIEEEISASFFQSLPEELQVAAQYVAKGGQDLKSLFQSLAAEQEIRQLDPSTEDGQEQIVRSYLHATNFGTPEEIEAELEEWKDQDKLEAKANQFKPKLDAMQEQIIQRKLQQQEAIRKQQQQQAKLYTDNIYKTLEPGELNGLKLDKKTQNMLFAGLTQANYPSMSGRPTNLLGHLLEKHQYGEPNHALISEALWLLADPEGYRAKVKEGGKKDAVASTVRTLKQEQSNRIASGSQEDDDDSSRGKKSSGIPRPSGGSFFKR